MLPQPLRCSLVALLCAVSPHGRRVPHPAAGRDGAAMLEESAGAARFTPGHALHAALAATGQQVPMAPSAPVVVPPAPPGAMSGRGAPHRPRPAGVAMSAGLGSLGGTSSFGSFERFVKGEQNGGSGSAGTARSARSLEPWNFRDEPTMHEAGSSASTAISETAEAEAEASAESPATAEKDAAEMSTAPMDEAAPAELEPIAVPDLDLVVAEAKGVMNGKPGPHNITIPLAWSKKFDLSTLTTDNHAAPGHIYGTGTASLLSDPSHTVRFVAMRAKDPATLREIEMTRALRDTGAAPVLIDAFVHPDVIYILTSPVGWSLSKVTDRTTVYNDQDFRGTEMTLSPKRLIAVASAILRNLIALEEAGIVHADLSERNILMSDTTAAVQFGGLHACHENGEAFDEGRGFVGSAFRQPPETKGEQVDGFAANVWGAGLILARLMLGGDIPTVETAVKMYSTRNWNDESLEGREKIRQAVRHSFALSKFDSFIRVRSHNPGLLNIVAGMLQPDPERRLTAAQALQMLEETAEKMSVTIPAPADDPVAAVGEWMRAWREQPPR